MIGFIDTSFTVIYSAVANLPTSQITRPCIILVLVLHCTPATPCTFLYSCNLRLNSTQLLNWTELPIESESYVTADGQPASLSWNKASMWGLRPDLYYCLTVAGLLIWGALSDERSGLSFVCAAGPCQRSLSQVRVPWDLRPYFSVSDLRLPFSLPPTTRSRLLRLTGSRWRYSTPPPHG
jgi:hypothetical protein